MPETDNILISLVARYADGIFAGEKTVEFRRRVMHVEPGTYVWVYVKMPVASIVGRVRVGSIHASSPAELWKRFGSVSGLSHPEFCQYFSGSSQGTALVLEDAQLLPRSLPLQDIREVAKGFHPPQFFVRLSRAHPVLEAVHESLSLPIEATLR